MKNRIAFICFWFSALLFTVPAGASTTIVVSVPDQRLAVVDDGVARALFPVSTSKYGLGDQSGSYRTPLGTMEVASRIGVSAPLGTVFKSRKPTGEILRPNAVGRDPIVTRILWLRGCERRNAAAYGRNIYIHGTPVERLIGRPASYGCIRMRSQDIVQVFNAVSIGTKINVVDAPLSRALANVRHPADTANTAKNTANTANMGKNIGSPSNRKASVTTPPANRPS